LSDPRTSASLRLSFGKIPEILPIPDLIAIQRQSFEWLITDGLRETFDEISPIEDFTGQMALTFGEHRFEEPEHSVEECRERDNTYSRKLHVQAEFQNRTTGEIKSQSVFMGDFPVMTDQGTFIINGTERVVTSQLVRSPGVIFEQEPDKTLDKLLTSCRVIPARGAWLEFDVDKKDTVGVRLDRKRRLPVTVLLRGLGMGDEQIRERFGESETMMGTL
jgi:DNA-directed RNA polymerase subunit beta